MNGLSGVGSVIGLDVGGTLIKAVAVRPDGTVSAHVRQPTWAGHSPEALIERVVILLAGMREELSRRGEVLTAVGLAVPGLIDETTGVVHFAANLGWRDQQVVAAISQRLGAPVYLCHDVRSGALAEGVLGAARGCEDFLFVPIGTGIAGALVLGGQVRASPRGLAGELGHLIVKPGGPPCRCGARGCLEAIASASSLARLYQGRVRGEAVSAAEVAARAAEGEPDALEVWSSAVEALGHVLAALQSLLDLELFVIGGGLANSETLLSDLEASIRASLTCQSPPRLARAALGDEAGSLGAALLARAGGGTLCLQRC